MKKDVNEREQVIQLKDGRTIFKTHNGFRSFVDNGKKVSQVSDAYYSHVKKHSVNKLNPC